jgi:hypothetical protein
MAEIDSQLNLIEQTWENNLNQTEQDKLRKRQQDLKDKLIIARANEKDAPMIRQKAELDYARSINPSNPEDVMISFYKTEGNKIKEKILKTAREKINNAVDSQKYANSQKKFIQSQKEGFQEGFQDSEPLTLRTLYRKMELYTQHNNTITLWIDLMNCIILAYAFVMIYDLRSNLLDPVVSMTILATFASVFILDKMIYFIYLIPSFIIKHLGWGSDRIQNTVWLYLYVPIIALVLYIIIYNLIV